MTVRVKCLTIDCADPYLLAGFWQQVTGFSEMAGNGNEPGDPEGLLIAPGDHPDLLFIAVPEPKQGKNRLHLDLKVSGGRAQPPEVRTPRIRATVDRLTAAGATTLQEHQMHGHLDHVVLADPEGNEFCVV